MNNQKNYAEWALRLGLGFTFLYSGSNILMHSQGWYWAIYTLPQSIQNIINTQIGIDNYLKFQGIEELALALIFFSWFLPHRILKFAALVAVFEMTFILLFVGVRLDTFRDIGLLGAALSLFIMSWSRPPPIE